MFGLLVALVLVVEVVVLVVLTILFPNAPVIYLVPALPLTLTIALLARHTSDNAVNRARRLSPDDIAGYLPEQPAESTPEELSRSIVERAEEIQRALADSPSDPIRVEMCAIGYRACANDMITLTHHANEEIPSAGPLRRAKLRRARKKATDALAAAREALPPGALRASRQEQQ